MGIAGDLIIAQGERYHAPQPATSSSGVPTCARGAYAQGTQSGQSSRPHGDCIKAMVGMHRCRGQPLLLKVRMHRCRGQPLLLKATRICSRPFRGGRP